MYEIDINSQTKTKERWEYLDTKLHVAKFAVLRVATVNWDGELLLCEVHIYCYFIGATLGAPRVLGNRWLGCCYNKLNNYEIN